MKKTWQRCAAQRRAIVGIEAAIVLIALVLVGAALAFTVLNIGGETTQKAKTSIVSTLRQTGSALEVTGRVVGSGHVAAGAINVTGIPIRIAAGGNSVNLAEQFTAVKLITNDVTYSDIYQGTINAGTQESLQAATAQAAILSYIDNDPYVDNAFPSQTAAFVYWTKNDNDNDILDVGEHAMLGIAFSQGDRPTVLDTMKIEIIVADGSTLTIERQIPLVSNQVVDLG